MRDDIDLLVEWAGSLETWDIVLAIGLPLLVWLLRHPLANLGIALGAKALGQFEVKLDQTARDGARPAMSGFIVMIAIFVSVATLDLPRFIGTTIERILQAILVFFLFWLINQVMQLLLEQGGKLGISRDYAQGSWIRQILRLVLIILMLVVILKIWGIDLGPALTGLGIAGAAIALAAQDLIRNLIAGFNNAGEMRFRKGDWIRVPPDLEGIVEDVNLRSTVLRRFDKGLVHVPNADLANTSLINFSRRTARRILWNIALTYDTPVEMLDTVCARIRDYIRENDRYADERDAHVFVTAQDFADSSITVTVDCFAATNQRREELETRHDLLIAIKRIVEESGAEFAYPTRTVYARNPQSAP